jgi:hypothetical protein
VHIDCLGVEKFVENVLITADPRIIIIMTIIIIIPTIIKEDSSLFPLNHHTRTTSVSNRNLIYVFLLLYLCILIVCLCTFIVPAGTLRLPWLRFFRGFSSVVRQMPRYNPQRWGMACTLPIFLCCSMYCLFLCCSPYFLFCVVLCIVRV